MDALTFTVSLPPGKLSIDIVEEILHILLKENRVFTPGKYGHIFADIKIDNKNYDHYLGDLLDCYRKDEDLLVQKWEEYILFLPDRKDRLSLHGSLVMDLNKKDNLLAGNEAIPVLEKIISLVKSPLAICSCYEVYRKHQTRLIDRGNYSEEVPTVKGCAHGLTHAFWRMWFGKEYTEFFGLEMLDKAPVSARHYQNGIYFVQLFESPYDGDTPEGKVAAERFKDAVGRDTFYDPDDPEKILKAPDFHHLLQEY